MFAAKNVLTTCKKELVDIYKYAVESVKPETLISKSVNFKSNKLTLVDRLNDKTFEVEIGGTRIHVLGAGKCVLGLASGLGDVVEKAGLRHKFSHGSISVPIDLRSQLDETRRRNLGAIKVECSFGSAHNLPDTNSVMATNSILDSIYRACEEDRSMNLRSLFLVLISGGGSACLTSPKQITLDEKLNLMKQLVQRGADIVELNKVRRCLSNVKGGNLARHVFKCNPEARIVTLLLSDVIDDPVEFIASGPTHLFATNDLTKAEEQMQTVLRKYGLQALVKSSPSNTMSFNDGDLVGKTSTIILGNNDMALDHASECAIKAGYCVHRLNMPLEGLTDEALTKMLSFCDRHPLSPGDKLLFLAGGETTVKLQSEEETWGTGGRVQEFCLDYLIRGLRGYKIDRDCIDMLLAASTDGQDGPTDVAACLTSLVETGTLIEHDGLMKFDINVCLQAKRSHDSYKFWSSYKPDWIVKTGLTGTNVMDLYMCARIHKPAEGSSTA